MSKQASFTYSKWKLSSQMDSSAFIEIITGKFVFLKNKMQETCNSKFLMKLKFPRFVTRKF